MKQAVPKMKHLRSIPLCFGISGRIPWNAPSLQLIETLHFWNSSFIYTSISSEIRRYESILRESRQTQCSSLPWTSTDSLKREASSAKTVRQRNLSNCFVAFGKHSKSTSFQQIFDTLVKRWWNTRKWSVCQLIDAHTGCVPAISKAASKLHWDPALLKMHKWVILILKQPLKAINTLTKVFGTVSLLGPTAGKLFFQGPTVLQDSPGLGVNS